MKDTIIKVEKPPNCHWCDNQWICRIKQEFEKPLLEARHCIENGSYPDLCMGVFGELASKCKKYIETIEIED